MNDSTFPLSPAAIALPAVALITLLLDAAPLIWHIGNHNLAASSLISWICLSNLMNLINPFIWPRDDVQNWWPGFGLCDVEVKLSLAFSIGTATSLLCIMRNLARVLDTERAVMSLSKAQRRRQVVMDCLLCFGAPVYLMAIHYFVQSSRYYIFAISGCTSSFDDSWPTLVLVHIWAPIACLVNLYYSVLVIVRMHRYRRSFAEVLASSNSSLTKNRFMRLFLMAFTLIVIVVPVQFFVLYKNANVTLTPYSWSRMHGPHWWDIMLVPTQGTVAFDRWIQIGAGFFVFFFFGMGHDAVVMYRKWLLKMGAGRVFPTLIREDVLQRPSDTSTSHVSSIGSRARSLVEKAFSRHSAHSLHSSESQSPVPLSPTLPRNYDKHLSTIIEYGNRASCSTAPSTPFSTDKTLRRESTQKLTWLGRFLVSTHIAARER